MTSNTWLVSSGCSRKGIVDERDVMTDEDVVFDVHAFANEGVTRDFATLADRRVFLDFDECANLGFVANFAAVNIDKTGKLHIFPELHVVSDADKFIHRDLIGCVPTQMSRPLYVDQRAAFD